VSRGFLLIGASLFDRIGRWDGRRFYVDVGAGSYNFAEFGEYILYAGALCRFRDGLRRYIRAGCLWGITTEGVERCWRSAWGACL
jgi:hypothetical protein